MDFAFDLNLMKTFPSGDNGGHVYIYDHATTGMIPKELWAQEVENKNNEEIKYVDCLMIMSVDNSDSLYGYA